MYKLLRFPFLITTLFISSLANAGLIRADASYTSINTTGTFSWSMEFDESYLSVGSEHTALSDPALELIQSLDIVFTDESNTVWLLDLEQLKDANVILSFDYTETLIADSSNQISKIFDQNFSGLANLWDSQGIAVGPVSCAENALCYNGGAFAMNSYTLTPVPEPSSIAIFMIGGILLIIRRLTTQ